MHERFTRFLSRPTLILMLAVLVSACGGAGDEPVAPPAVVGPGELKSFALLNTISPGEIGEALAGEGLSGIGITPVYSVTSYRLEYLTTDAQGRIVRASGLVSVPVKGAGARSPVLGYQHGTIFRDAEAPGNNAVASEISIVLASLGYIVVAPDYVGYGASLGTPHPYLLAGPAAAAVVDFLTAARTWRHGAGVIDNGQLFLTGYSEGGYVTMAAHRAMQQDNSAHLPNLLVEVPGAGPYDVQATLDGLLDLVRDEEPILGALLNPGLLRRLGSTVRDELRRALLRRLLPEDADVSIDTTFLDLYLADDTAAIARSSSVHDWLPAVPVRMFHGRDDRTVPYASALSALRAMHARGAGDLVSLSDCRAAPPSHIGCVPSFLTHVLEQLAPHAQDL